MLCMRRLSLLLAIARRLRLSSSKKMPPPLPPLPPEWPALPLPLAPPCCCWWPPAPLDELLLLPRPDWLFAESMSRSSAESMSSSRSSLSHMGRCANDDDDDEVGMGTNLTEPSICSVVAVLLDAEEEIIVIGDDIVRLTCTSDL